MLNKYLRRLGEIALLGYLLFCCSVYFLPQYYFYAPDTSNPDLINAQNNGFKAEEVTYASSDGTKLYGWFVKPKAGHKIVVYFHGNSHNIGAFYNKLIPFTKKGYGVFIGEYRGFGGIEGKLSEANLASDAIAAVDYLNSLGYKNSDMIIYGMSLGSYTAVNTVYVKGKQNKFASLVLEVPFDSVINVVKQRFWPVFPFDLIVKDRYENLAKIKDIDIPVLIMGAEKDKVVPVARAKALFNNASEPKKLIIYDGAGHSDLYDYKNYQDILQWLEQNEKTK